MPYFSAYAMTHAFLPAMVKRNSGHILNVNSPLCKMIWRGTTSYTAVRWALRAFSKALAADLAHTNVNVSHYICGAVKNSYWDHNPDSLSRFPMVARQVLPLSSDQAAVGLCHALEHNKHEYVYPFAMRLVLWQHAVMPWLVNGLMRMGSAKYPN